MTDLELQFALARMLPEKLSSFPMVVWWNYPHGSAGTVKDTEWLHVVWLIEQGLDCDLRNNYCTELEFTTRREAKTMPKGLNPSRVIDWLIINASWQQRARALIAIRKKSRIGSSHHVPGRRLRSRA